ncbi:MAG: hypothetical protein MJZ91_07055 [Bacteroidales bacterium]|nr:hypothetical protein [Bacteroidales bacterium]
MKYLKFFIVVMVSVFALTACNKGEGEGGTGAVQGLVKLVQHPDDDLNLNTDTVPAAKTDVFIVYGDDSFYGDDVETGPDGLYRFEYLRPGNYTLFAYSTLPTGEKIPVKQSVNVQNGQITDVPTIYIHDGKAYGTSIVKGLVYAEYYHNGSYRGEGWACDHRVYIRKAGENMPIDDTRVGPDGYFYFQKLLPGEYEVYTSTENFMEVPEFVFQTIMVEDAGAVYELEEQFEIIINV